MASEKPSSKGQAWFCTTGLPSDIVIEVGDMTFHLHKFPLMSKSLKLHELITELEKKPKTNFAKNQKLTEEERDPDNDNDNDDQEIEEAAAEDDDDEHEHEDEYSCHIALPDFPGGSEAFETAAKFCYGVKIELSPSNVAPLRCAGDFLQMTDEYSEDNLISKTERYLSQIVPKNIKHSIQTFHSCEKLSPLAENLGIVQRCIEAIASKASSTDPSLFGWPVNDKGIIESASSTNTISARRKLTSAATTGGADVWFDELSLLSLQSFKRLILTMKEKDVSAEIIENCLMYYAKKYIPGISRSNRKSTSSAASSSSSIPSESEQRELLETVITSLPKEKSSSSSSATRFLFGLLRTANILNSSEECRATLEKKIGSQLEQATLDDLLIPSYSYLNETLYDVDCVERILGYFQQGWEERSSSSRIQVQDEDSSLRSAALMLVGKLIDGYLSEIASDANLKPDRFYQLAVSLPEQARLFDDGLYRAVDVYLKAHPWISESEREKICGLLDCQKLTLEACTHAAQNERLPLRAVVQVLFFEQLQLRHAIAGTLLAADLPPALETGRQSSGLGGGGEDEEEVVGIGLPRTGEVAEGNTWRTAVRENQVLRLDMDSMRTRVHELERECSTMKKAIEKIDKMGPPNDRVRGGAASSGGGGGGGWRSKFGCKFKTQVCDSHSSATVVEARKGRSNRHQ